MSVLTGLRLSFGLFTALPVGDVGAAASDRKQVRRAILWSPVVAGVLGLCAALILAVERVAVIRLVVRRSAEVLPGMTVIVALLGAVLAVGFVVVATRGLHLDGLADTADAFAAGGDRDRTLAVMRRSDIGPLGVAAIVLVLLLEVATLWLATARGHGSLTIVTALVAGRVAAVWCCRYGAARPDGLGAWVAHSVTTMQALALTALAMLVPAAFLLRDNDSRGLVVPFAVLAIPIAVAVVLLLQRRWRRRLGGITGDTLGASVEIGTVVAMTLLALAPT